jgi:hypothetical protein
VWQESRRVTEKIISSANETVQNKKLETPKKLVDSRICICHAERAPKISPVSQPRRSSMKRQSPRPRAKEFAKLAESVGNSPKSRKSNLNG